jgi:hypothetical protein
MAANTLNGLCSTCDTAIDYDGISDSHIMCDGYCRRAFHLNCLNFTMSASLWKNFRTRKEFLFFCDHCRELQKSFVIRRNFLEAERSTAGLIEILHTATRDVDLMCRSAVESVSAAVSALKKSCPLNTEKEMEAVTPGGSVINLVSPVQTRRKSKKKRTIKKTLPPVKTPTVAVTENTSVQRTSTPNEVDNEEFLTPLPIPIPKKRTTTEGFFGTADTDGQITAAEDKKTFVISRVHPATTSDGIINYIKERTGIENIRCQLMLAKGRTISDVDFVSFKICAAEADYAELMRPEVWPAKVLVRDFVKSNPRRRGGAAGFHRF